MWIKEEAREMSRSVTTAGDSSTLSNTVEILERLEKGYRRCQKIRETSKPLVGLS